MWWLRSFLRRGPRSTEALSPILRPALGSAAAAAALAQRITGAGSGPYSGTPFSPIASAAAGAAPHTLAAARNDAVCRDCGLLHTAWHESSLGQR